MATTSPVRTSSTMPAEALALNFSRAATSSSRSACWTRRSTASVTGSRCRAEGPGRHPQIARRRARLLLPVGGEAGPVQVRDPARVEPLLDARDALVVDVDVTEEMRDLRPVGKQALVLGQEADARNAQPMDLGLLLRADLGL